jgi:hypothetical protein
MGVRMSAERQGSSTVSVPRERMTPARIAEDFAYRQRRGIVATSSNI